MRQLEPFTELLNSKQSWKTKLMRLRGRAPYARRQYTSSGPIATQSLPKLKADLAEIKRELDETGFAGVFSLSNELVTSIKTEVAKEPFYNRTNPSESLVVDLDNPQAVRNGHIYSSFDPHERSTPLRDLISSDLRPVAEAYLGPMARLLNSQIWITFPGATAETNKDFGWHYDVDDFKFLKFFCYLNDVHDLSGPHSIVPSSHRSRHVFRFFNRQVDDLIVKTFGEPLSITGKAGSCFFEDTIIYHKGNAPKKKHRIILQVQFGVTQ